MRAKAHNESWWTVEEFADLTRRTPAAVRASILRSKVPAVRIGRRYFINSTYFELQFEKAAREVEANKTH